MKLFFALSLCTGQVLAQSNDTNKLMAAADAIEAAVSRGRGLPILHETLKKLTTQEGVRAMLLADFDKEFMPGELEGAALTFKKLTLLRPEDNYREMMLSTWAEQIAGYYDPEQKELFLVEELSPSRETLAHEICHALQDQSFDLKKIMAKNKEMYGADGTRAIASLIEGDAMAVMLEDSLGWKGFFASLPNLPANIRKLSTERDQSSVIFMQAPKIIQEEMTSPYLDGLQFVHSLRQTGTWSVIDKAFHDPPASTEQILHPERYITRDNPTMIKSFSLSGLEITHKKIYEDVFGELRWRIWFRQFMPEADAKKAAAGWDGDRVETFGPKALSVEEMTQEDLSSLVVASVSIWDTEVDAKEAAEAFTLALLEILPGSKRLESGVVGDEGKPGSSHGFVIVEGNKILFALGASGVFVSTLKESLASVSNGVSLVE